MAAQGQLITIIGAGVTGLATALALAERGAAVEVVERSATLGAEACSRLAGAMIAPWCEGESAEPAIVRHGQDALDYWRRVHPATVQQGSLVLAAARDGAELDSFDRRSMAHEWVDADRIGVLEPDLAGRFRRGLFFPQEAHLDPRAALASVHRLLLSLGVEVRFGVDGDSLRPVGPVVDCRGLAARDRLPNLRGVRGEMLLLRCPDLSFSRPIRLLHPRTPIYLVPRGEGLYMLGATMIESDARGQASVRSVVQLLNALYALHPGFADAEIAEIGCDARPSFPDNIPRLTRTGGRLHVNGLYRHGFLLAPALARTAAAVLLDGADCPEMEAGACV
jgi:glycine oxidase